MLNLEWWWFINLKRLDKPYARGGEWIIHERTTSPFISNGVYKTKEKAVEKYNLYKETLKIHNIGIRDEVVYLESENRYWTITHTDYSSPTPKYSIDWHRYTEKDF